MPTGGGGLCEAAAREISMIVTVFGGSAPSTPALFFFLASERHGYELDFRLVGRSGTRLEAVARAAKVLVGQHPIRVETFLADVDATEWLNGADVVVIQARFGGLHGRLFDESFPLRYGLCGDEGLGPGGLSAAWRSWPLLKDLLTAIGRESPDAFVILLTSPVSILTRLACSTFCDLRIAGICELPWTTLRAVCDSVGVSSRGVRYSYSGVNHIGWFHRISAGSRDVMDEYAVRREQAPSFPSGELIRACEGVPLKSLRLHYEPEQVLAEQRVLPPRSEVLGEITDRALAAFHEGSDREIVEALWLRPTPWYEHAVGPLLLALAGDKVTIPFFLSTTNADGDVVETAHEFRDGELKPIVNGSAPPAAIRETLKAFVEYERVAAEAVSLRDEHRLAHAVEKHPWISERRISPWVLVQEITRSV